MSLPKFLNTDLPVTMLQTRWAAILDPVIDNVTANLGSASFARYNTTTGYGSVNTYARNIVNQVSTIGDAITVIQDSKFGTSVVVNTPGVYAVTYTDQFNASADMAVTLNYSTIGVSPSGIPPENILCITTTVGANTTATISWVGILNAKDVIKFNADTTPTGNIPGLAQFTVTFGGILN